MGIVHAEITIKNVADLVKANSGIVNEHEIRQNTIKALVDTGAGTLVINEELCQKLGLEIRGTRQATLANNSKTMVKIAAPVEVHWKNRSMTCQPLVMEGSGENLLGSIPLEDMDLMVDPVRQELTGAHGDEIVSLLK